MRNKFKLKREGRRRPDGELVYRIAINTILALPQLLLLTVNYKIQTEQVWKPKRPLHRTYLPAPKLVPNNYATATGDSRIR